MSTLTDNSIAEQNKLLAEFMGWEFKEGIWNSWFINGVQVNSELAFHSSWDWLMPVVKEVESMNATVSIDGNACFIIKQIIEEDRVVDVVDITGGIIKAETKIEATYKSVIKFIEWYNKNKK